MADNVKMHEELQKVADEAWRKFEDALAKLKKAREEVLASLGNLPVRDSTPS